MKLLLDENLPFSLRLRLPGHEVFTVAYMKWKGVENGALLALAAQNGYDAFITKDLGIAYEQNVGKLGCSAIILEANSNAMSDIEPLIPALLAALSVMKPKTLIRVRA